MGTDIKCFVEKRNKKGIWKQIRGFRTAWGTDATSPLENRNYDMFAVMADVRNGYGFAGVITGEPVEPIAEPRGLPDDASAEVAEVLACDFFHSVSWLDVKELMEYDSNQPKKHQGYVSAEDYRTFKETGKPSWPRGTVYAPKCSNDEIEELTKKHPDKRYVTLIRWEEPIAVACSPLFDTALEQLKERCTGGDYEGVRIVFGFDN